MSDQRDLELLYELGAFRYVLRTWRQFLNGDFANNAEHSFRVVWTALIIARREGVGNHEKILKMALVHDLPESRAGDAHYLSRMYVDRHEELAVTDMFADTSLGQEVVDLWREYEAKSSIEAKIVKDADNLDVDLELQEQSSRGNQLRVDFKVHRDTVKTHKLSTKSAKQIWEQIQNSNPHDWHLRARNRFTAGDWHLTETPQVTAPGGSGAEGTVNLEAHPGWRTSG